MSDALNLTEPAGNIALPWYLGGMSVVPIRPGGNKKPHGEWGHLQQERLTQEQVDSLWHPKRTPAFGVGVICGAVSGDLEMTELEADAISTADLTAVRNACAAHGVLDLWDQLTLGGYAEVTPSGGLHLFYRISDHKVPGNKKIAMRLASDGELNEAELEIRRNNPDQRILRTRAETRGEGGYAVVAPTAGHCHNSGEPWTTTAGAPGVVPTISWEQRETLHRALFDALDKMPVAPTPPPRVAPQVRFDGEMRPGDMFEQAVEWTDAWFTNLGWSVSHHAGGETFWVRPGKESRDGHSATTGYRGTTQDRLYVFSTSAGLPTEEPLTKFFVYAHYYHGGNMAAAASDIRRRMTPLRVAAAVQQPQRALVGPVDDGVKDAAQTAMSEQVHETSTVTQAFQQQVSTGAPGREVTLPPQGGVDLSDIGSGKRMLEKFGDMFRYNITEKRWYFWNNVAWEADWHDNVMRAAIEVAEHAHNAAAWHLWDLQQAGESGPAVKAAERAVSATQANKNVPRLNAALRMFAAQPGISVTSEQLDKPVHLVNLTNGTLDLKTGEFRDAEPKDLLTRTMGAAFDKSATCPKWDSFIAEAFPDANIRAYVQRAMGYTFTGTTGQRAIFFLHGPSGTGKSVLTSVMTKLFGKYGMTAPASTFRLKQQSDGFDLHRLRGARFVATSELPEGQMLDEDLVKRLTGNDEITSRGLYENFTTWSARCTVWIATNYLPNITSDDNAIWRRAKTIPMKAVVGREREIDNFAEVMFEEERDGILNWVLDGWQQYLDRGLDEPTAITQDVDTYRTEIDVVASFIRDSVDEGTMAYDATDAIPSRVFRQLFEAYCDMNGQKALGVRRVAMRMRNLGYAPTKIGGVAKFPGLRQQISNGVRGTWS